MPTNLEVALLALGWAGAAAAVGLLVLRLRPRRTVRARLVAVAAVTVATLVAGVLGAARAMFISVHDLGVVLKVATVAGAVALAVALVAGRVVVREVDALVDRARRLGTDHTPPTQSPPVLVDLARVDQEIESAAHRLAQGAERERALEAARRELVAWVSHDLRTPLAGIRAMAEALEDGVARDPGRYAKQIAIEVDRLSGLVDDLFELSRIQAGTLVGATHDVDVRELVHDAVLTATARAQAIGTTIIVHDGTADAGQQKRVVSGDAAALGRAVSNLVTNALQYGGPDGCVRVDLGIRARHVVVGVQDSCGGIATEDLPRVFEPGWRASRARTPLAEGTGAGLGTAIARGIARAHGGDVSVANVSGGCRFELSLPRPTHA